MATDAYGLPIDFKITGGEVHDSQVAEELIVAAGPADHVVADKGYDSEKVRTFVRSFGSQPVIPRRNNSFKENHEYLPSLYRYRHLIENLFARIKHYRSIATRFEKLARNFRAMVSLACTLIWMAKK